MSSFIRKKIEITLTMATGNFGSSQSNTLTIKGLRAIVEIRNAATVMPEATVKIYGMKQSDMNQLSVLTWRTLGVLNNTILIKAGDDGSVLGEVFSGTLVKAFPDYQSAPDVFFYIEAQTAYFEQINSKDVTPNAFSSAFDIAAFIGTLAKKMGFTFENNCGVVIHPNHTFNGTLLTQTKEAARIANLDLYIDKGIIAITPQYGSRTTRIPTLNKDSGLIGYPTLNNTGIQFMCLYNPAITFGGQVIIGAQNSENQTAKTNAELQKQDPTRNPVEGNWVVCNLTHQLESEMPNGAWFSHVACTEVGYGPVVN